ncbi:MAG: methyltransferase domain-containing protein [Candidatus Sulfotelmatobacter sp.]
MLLFNRYAKSYFRSHTRVLEVGPGLPPSGVQRSVGDDSIRWETAGMESTFPLTYIGTEYSYPIESDAADVVVATNVMEHVRKPWVWIRELARICKPGGYVITINPVSWPYHEYPIDCWRAYPEGMQALYEDAQLRVVMSRCESLEDAHLRRHIPGRSLRNIYDHGGWKMKALAKISETLGLPVERPYDTVTIGQK